MTALTLADGRPVTGQFALAVLDTVETAESWGVRTHAGDQLGMQLVPSTVLTLCALACDAEAPCCDDPECEDATTWRRAAHLLRDEVRRRDSVLRELSATRSRVDAELAMAVHAHGTTADALAQRLWAENVDALTKRLTRYTQAAGEFLDLAAMPVFSADEYRTAAAFLRGGFTGDRRTLMATAQAVMRPPF